MRSRSRSDYISQLVSDIVYNHGYNEFLAERLFSVNEVSPCIAQLRNATVS